MNECKKKLSDDTGCWSDQVNKQFANAPIVRWIPVLAKGGGQKKRFQYCVNPNYPQKFLYLGEQSKDIQEVQSILHCETMYCNQKVSPSIVITSETEKN